MHDCFLTKSLAYLDALAFEEMNYREQEIREAHTDSCTWVLKHASYLEWNRRGSGLLGIRGKPGSGKSTLMKRIFQIFNDQTSQDVVQLAFFFHRRGTPLQQTLLGMFRTLLYQLLTQIPTMGGQFRTLCEEKRKWQEEPGKNWNWRVEELRPVFCSTLLAAAKHSKITMFVDALDEASHGDSTHAFDQDRDQTAQDIVSFLYEVNEKLVAQSAATSICFSCRHFPIIAVRNGYEIVVENNNHDDIVSYTHENLKNRLDIEAEPGAEDIIVSLREKIVSRASGVFMWVVLIVPLVASQYNKGYSLETIEKNLSAVPNGLHDIYQHILTREIYYEDRPKTLLVMSWIYLAGRPLSVPDLRFALASDDDSIHAGQNLLKESKDFVENDYRMKRLITSLTGGLAEVKIHNERNKFQTTSQLTTVQFIHQSVNDFLGKDRFRCLELSSDKDFIGHGHHRLARSCLNYLKLRETREKVQTILTESNSNIWFHIHVREIIYGIPFLAYAASHWFVHVQHAEYAGLSQEDLLERLDWPSQALCREMNLTFNTLRPEDRIGPGASLLHMAARFGLSSTVRRLLRTGVDVDMEDDSRNKPLHYAATGGHEEVVQILLEAHATIDTENCEHETPIMRAAMAGHLGTVKLLLDSRGDSSLESRADKALIAAAGAGHATLVNFLLQMGANVNAHDQHRVNPTALQAAASCNGAEAVVQLLLENGAEVNAQGGFYGTALQVAASHRSETVVQLLLEGGAEVNAEVGLYGSALQAAAYNESEAVVRLLLNSGAEINAQCGVYGTALQAAALAGSEAVVQLLLNSGAEINAQCGKYGTALQAAALAGSEAVVRLLLNSGAEINAQCGEYGTALQAAACRSKQAIVRLLLENGADVDVQGGKYGTALQAAVAMGRYHVVQLLLEKGADVNATGGRYGTALRAAEKTNYKRPGHERIVKMLVEKGASATMSDEENSTTESMLFSCPDSEDDGEASDNDIIDLEDGEDDEYSEEDEGDEEDLYENEQLESSRSTLCQTQ